MEMTCLAENRQWSPEQTVQRVTLYTRFSALVWYDPVLFYLAFSVI